MTIDTNTTVPLDALHIQMHLMIRHEFSTMSYFILNDVLLFYNNACH